MLNTHSPTWCIRGCRTWGTSTLDSAFSLAFCLRRFFWSMLSSDWKKSSTSEERQGRSMTMLTSSPSSVPLSSLEIKSVTRIRFHFSWSLGSYLLFLKALVRSSSFYKISTVIIATQMPILMLIYPWDSFTSPPRFLSFSSLTTSLKGFLLTQWFVVGIGST